MSPKKPTMPPIKRKHARGKIRPPLKSWFQTDLQKDRKKHPEFYLADFYYVRMLERNILTVQYQSFGLHPCILSKPDTASLSPANGIVLAYLLVEALREYARSEWAWLNKDPGQFSRELRQIAQRVLDWQEVLEDSDQLAKALRSAARKVRRKWTEENAVEQAFLYPRRRLIRDIRLIVDEIIPLPKSKRTTITNRLCAALLHVFDIKTHKGQSLEQLYSLVRKDRQRNEARFREVDGMLRSHLQDKIGILKNHTHGNVAFHPLPHSKPALPPCRISPTPPGFLPSYPPLLDPTDYSFPNLYDLY